MPTPPTCLRRVSSLVESLYRYGLGWTLGRRFLRLTHVGRRSGRRYGTVLEVVHHDPGRQEYVVVSGFGTRADWLRNIEANTAQVTVGTLTFTARHRRLGTAEAVAVFAEYERRSRVAGPIVRRALSWLLGWHYDGSDGARRRMAGQLPLVAFRPERVETDRLPG